VTLVPLHRLILPRHCFTESARHAGGMKDTRGRAFSSSCSDRAAPPASSITEATKTSLRWNRSMPSCRASSFCPPCTDANATPPSERSFSNASRGSVKFQNTTALSPFSTAETASSASAGASRSSMRSRSWPISAMSLGLARSRRSDMDAWMRSISAASLALRSTSSVFTVCSGNPGISSGRSDMNLLPISERSASMCRRASDLTLVNLIARRMGGVRLTTTLAHP